MHLNWLKKLNSRGPGPWLSNVNIIVNYCCTRVLLHAKMLEETKETLDFLLLVVFLLRGSQGLCPPPPWLRLCEVGARAPRSSILLFITVVRKDAKRH